MQLDTEALSVALRVLTAISEYRPPDPADVASLRQYAPLLSHEPLDELACDVIRKAVQQRATARL